VRSVRHFTAEPVGRACLERVLDAARWTGSARNRQPWRFAVVTDALTRAQLAQMGDYAQHLADAPAVVVLLSNPQLGGADTEFDMGRVAQQLTSAAEAEGLGSCVATLHPDERAVAASRSVGAAEPWVARHAISLGHPAPVTGVQGRSAVPVGRRPLEQLVSWIGDG
jgi:nitroreductase